jgi:hypothetical protein
MPVALMPAAVAIAMDRACQRPLPAQAAEKQQLQEGPPGGTKLLATGANV